MSLEATVWALDLTSCPDGTPLNQRQKLILLIIADHHNNISLLSWPSLRTIALLALAGEATVKRDLRYLKEHGCIDWRTGGGRGRMCQYWFPGIGQPYEEQPIMLVNGPKRARNVEANNEGICESENPVNLAARTQSCSAAQDWVRLHSSTYKAFCLELRRRFGALVGVRNVDHKSVVRIAAQDTGVPEAIALELCPEEGPS